MTDWLFRHRDRVAVVASLGLLGAGWAMARFAPAPVPPPPPPDELRVTMEALPVQPPVPTPLLQPVPAPQTPAQPTPPVPMPTPTPVPTPVQAPTPSPLPAPVDAPVAPAPTAPVAPAAPQVAAAPVQSSPPTHAVPAPQLVAVQPAQRASVDEGYRAELRALIERAKRYPTSREARQLRPTGTVKVWLELDRAGALQGAGVEAGSGSLLLDQEALRTVRLGRYPAFPPEAFAGQERHRFTLSLDYRLEGS